MIISRTFTLFIGKFAPHIIRFALLTDVISIPIFSFFLNFQLRRLRGQGLIEYYKMSLRRIGKYYYELSLYLVFKSVQARRVLMELIAEMLKTA